MLTHFSLFSGIGGLDLAAEWAGFTTVGQCEYADYPTKVLEKHWPNVPRWRDIREVTAENFRERTGLCTIDIISGGFPCQPFSVAGNQKGKEDDRYLWPEMLRVAKELTPDWVVGENVPGILSIAADDICKDLEYEGYEVGIFDFEAAAVGAKHRRGRVFFVARNTNSKYEYDRQIKEIQRGKDAESPGICATVSDTDSGRSLEGQFDKYTTNDRFKAFSRSSIGCKNVADTYGAGCEELHSSNKSERERERERERDTIPGALLRTILTTPTSGEAVGSSGGNMHSSLRTDAGGQLNPNWVEWLMGFPPGWTDLNA